MISQGCSLFMEMGTGKTLTVINLAEMMFSIGKIRSAIVICPLSIIGTWNDELENYSSRSNWSLLVGDKRKRLEELESLRYMRDSFLKIAIINYDGISTIKEQLLKYKFDMVILDESVAIKNRAAQRTKLIIELFSKTSYKIIMSGNPIPKSPVDIFSQYKFLESGVFGINYYQFADKYFNVDYFNKIIGFKDEQLNSDFLERLHCIAFRKTKKECLDLPPKIYERIIVNMSPEQEEIYKQMKNKAIATYNDKTCAATVVITKFLRMSQIAGGFFPITDEEDNKEIKPILPNPKLEVLVDVIIDQIPETESIVIWAHFQEEIKTIEARLNLEGIKCVSFYGETTVKARIDARAAFKNKEVRVFVGSPASGGKGLNDLVGANYVIYYSNDYSADNRQQSEDRTNRQGTKGDKVLYIDLLMKDTIDIQVLDVLRSNQNFSDTILNHNVIL